MNPFPEMTEGEVMDIASPCLICGGVRRSDGLCPRCLITSALGSDDLFDAEMPAQLGEYDLIEEIAQGGNGVVWKARQRRLNRIVALKLLHEINSLPGEEAVRRFRIEAEAAAHLHHPHIVNVYEVGEIDGRWYLSMELLASSLRERSGAPVMPERTAADLVRKVALAVHYAHDRGILHRDLKPGNVLVDETGEPRVADFGLARFSQTDSTLTLAGAVIGTPAYMSPEQAAGGELTIASDVYGLGAILYELLSGRPPFEAPTALETLRKVTDTDARPLRGVDRDLEVIAIRCLEKAPAARYASALALAEELARWLDGKPIWARPADAPERLWKWMRRHPAWTAVWTLVMVLVAGVFASALLAVRRIEAERTEALRRLARQHSQSALSLVAAGEWHRALLSLVESIEIGSGEAEVDRMNRLRFECLVRQSPRLAMLWQKAPRHAQFTADSRGLLFFYERSACLYDAATGKALGPLLPVGQPIISGDANADGSRVILGTNDGKWTLWDPLSGTLIAEGNGRLHGFAAPGVCRAPGVFGGGRFVVAQGNRGAVFLSATGLPAGAAIQRRAPILWAVLRPEGSRVLSLTEENILRLGSDGAGPELQCPPGADHMYFLTDPYEIDAIQADKHWNSIVHWPEHVPKTTDRFSEPIFAQTFRRKNDWVLLARSPRGVSFFNGWSPVIPRLLDHGASGVAGAFDEAGVAALTLASDGSAQQWDLIGDRPYGPRLHSIGTPAGIALSGDGKSALIQSETEAWLWRWREPVRVPQSQITAPSMPRTTAGHISVRIGGDATALLCDAKTGEVILPPLHHSAPVLEANFSPGGMLLSTRSADVARIWETASGRPVTPPIIHPGLTETRWGGDGHLWTRGEDGWREVDVSPGSHSLAEMKMLARLLAAGKLLPGGDGGIAPLAPEELNQVWEQAAGLQPR